MGPRRRPLGTPAPGDTLLQRIYLRPYMGSFVPRRDKKVAGRGGGVERSVALDLEHGRRVIGRRDAAAIRTIVRALHLLFLSHADTLPNKKPQYLLGTRANASRRLCIHVISITQAFMRCTYIDEPAADEKAQLCQRAPKSMEPVASSGASLFSSAPALFPALACILAGCGAELDPATEHAQESIMGSLPM
jgi:hypothetical protein